MKKIKRLTALLLSAAILLAMAGCAKKDGDPDDPDSPNDPGSKDPERPEFVYASTFTKLDDIGMQSFHYTCAGNGQIYVIGSVQVGTRVIDPNEYSTPPGTVGVAKAAYDVDVPAMPVPPVDPSEGEPYEVPIYELQLFAIAMDGSGYKRLEGFVDPSSAYGYDDVKEPGDVDDDVDEAEVEKDPSVDEYSYINGFYAGPKGELMLMMQRSVIRYELPDDFDPETMYKWDYPMTNEETFTMQLLDETGAVKGEEINVSEMLGAEEGQYVYISSLAYDSDGNMYMAWNDTIAVVDPDGQKLFSVKDESGMGFYNLVKLRDGAIAVMQEGEIPKPDGESSWGVFLRTIDRATKSIGDKQKLPSGAWNLYSGSGEYDLYYSNGTNFLGLKLGEEEGEVLFNLINCDIISLGNFVEVMEDGSIVTLRQEWTGGDKPEMELATIRLVSSDTLPVKTTLTYACQYIDYNIRRKVIKFNRESDKYRIEVQDYSQYNTEDDYEAGLMKLQTEMLAGKIPDIIGTASMPISRLAAKGYLEDLWPFIDGDNDIGRSSLVEPVFNAMQSEDGKLWQITNNFSISTLAGSSSLVGDKMGWSFADFNAAFKKLPEGATPLGLGYTRENIFETILAMNMNKLIDWKTGECHFNDPDFAELLNFVALFPEEFDWEKFYEEQGDNWELSDSRYRMLNGLQMLTQPYISQWSAQEINLDNEILGGVTYIGYPTIGEGNGAVFNIYSGLAMSSKCKDKEGAWEFMRDFLTYDFQKEYTGELPTNKQMFDEVMKQLTERTFWLDENGEEIDYYTEMIAGREFKVKNYLTPELENKVIELINTTTTVSTNDLDITKELMDKCAAFFAGDKTAEETAALVQNSMRIYVSERM